MHTDEYQKCVHQQVSFPNHVDLCDRAMCENPLVEFRDRRAAAVVGRVLETTAVGPKIGSFGKVVDMPTRVSITYSWVGIYPSMNLDPVWYRFR
jgi:hypothetical protein